MQLQRNKRLAPLQSGQVWKIEDGYLQIAELGRHFIHYKLLRQPDQIVEATRMIWLGVLLSFLSQNEAELVGG